MFLNLLIHLINVCFLFVGEKPLHLGTLNYFEQTFLYVLPLLLIPEISHLNISLDTLESSKRESGILAHDNIL